MSVFAIDPLHPDVLKCLDCGCAVANVADLAQADDEPLQMTARQALRCWPGVALEVMRHDVACAWRLAEADGTAAGRRE
jgi:hypothetical protein